MVSPQNLSAQGILGPDFEFFFGGDSPLTVASAEAACNVHLNVLVTCVSMECPTFESVCPASNMANAPVDLESQTRVSCGSIANTICTSYSDPNCCMTDCALELQALVICAGGEILACREPSCNVTESPPFDDDAIANNSTSNNNNNTNTNNATAAASVSGLDLEECSVNDNQLSCLYRSNITEPNNDSVVFKNVTSNVVCSLDPGNDMNNLDGTDINLQDCQCQGATLVERAQGSTQECQCDVCTGSVDGFKVALNCSSFVENPFVIGDCTGQTCDGSCIRDIATNETATTAPTIVPTTSVTTSTPSSRPISYGTTSPIDNATITPSAINQTFQSPTPATPTPTTLSPTSTTPLENSTTNSPSSLQSNNDNNSTNDTLPSNSTTTPAVDWNQDPKQEQSVNPILASFLFPLIAVFVLIGVLVCTKDGDLRLRREQANYRQLEAAKSSLGRLNTDPLQPLI